MRPEKRVARSTVIYFLRHGEPDNPREIMKGTADFVLTKKGIRQIETQAKRLTKERIGALFSSPVKRCVQSAQIIADVLNENRVERDKKGQLVGSGGLRLREVNELIEWTSRLDGQPEERARARGEKEFNSTFEFREKVVRRMQSFLKMVLTKYIGQRVVAVSHQGPIDLLLFDLRREDYSHMPYCGLITEKGEMVKAEFDSEGKLIKVNRQKA